MNVDNLEVVAPAPTSTVLKFPDRNVLAGGLVACIVWLVALGLGHFGITIDPGTQTALSVVLGFAVVHFVPRSAQEIIGELNDGIVQMAQADPTSNVSYALPPVHVPAGQPAIIGGPPSAGGMPTLTLPPAANSNDVPAAAKAA